MLQKPFPQRKSLHLKRFNYNSPGLVFFVTTGTSNKQSYFSDHKISDVIVDELEYRRAAKEIKLFCYCIMPDHLHVLISFEETYLNKTGAFGERTLQNWVSAFKRHTSRIIGQRYAIKPLWQQNFYDHVVRSDESLVEICQYILNNPVRKGMSATWDEYPYSRVVDSLPV